MKNTIGNPATGDDFYPRDPEIDQIYRRLDAGGNLYINAPRRVGKTSIMLNLQTNPRPGYLFVYRDFEACESAHEFFQQIVEALLQSDLKHPSYSKLAHKTREWVKSNLPAIKGIELPGFKLELGETEATDWAAKCASLLASLPEKDQRIVLLVDEYPQVVENILASQDEGAAKMFLHEHRAFRQNSILEGKVQFVLTGSINLRNTVSKASDLKVVNDLDYVKVGPLSIAQAEDMIQRLLETDQKSGDASTVKQWVERIDWLIPYHIQIWVKGVLHLLNSANRYIVNFAVVDEAFERIFDSENRPIFEHSFSRLPKAYKGDELKFVYQLLTLCADHSRTRMSAAKNLAEKHNCIARFYDILDSLTSDGYLAQTEEEIHFQSMILKEWWHRYESRKHR
jgi:uncharacterized protein